MLKVKDVCRHVRSKNAGPFWVTIDLFFDGPESYARFHDSPVLAAASIAAIYGVDPKNVRRFEVPELNVVKLSYARPHPQGGVIERDMHSGQQYVRLLQLELSESLCS
jgi:hypothetical protein